MRAAIFDMDGTLADSLGYFDKLWRAIGDEYFGGASFRAEPDVDKTIRTKTLYNASLVLREVYSIPDTEEGFFGFCTRILEEYYKEDVKLKEGVAEFLDELDKRGIPACVASATEPRLIRLSLEKCGVADRFKFIISCTEVGRGKERPDIFMESARRLGAEVSETCVFEDSFIALETAKNAGFMTVGVSDKNNYEQQRLKAASAVYVADGMSFKDIL